MNPDEVRKLLLEQLTVSELFVSGEGSHFEIVAIGDVFQGMRPVQKQQLIYAPLVSYIADGTIHAVNIKTYTDQEWADITPRQD
ncbi:MAG: acid stress-induced BolA-like protein IbaG/YrbA [Halieaceae bacterium]|jgi:acid stress-induced BolA-like protein IbaG/YrbA